MAHAHNDNNHGGSIMDHYEAPNQDALALRLQKNKREANQFAEAQQQDRNPMKNLLERVSTSQSAKKVSTLVRSLSRRGEEVSPSLPKTRYKIPADMPKTCYTCPRLYRKFSFETKGVSVETSSDSDDDKRGPNFYAHGREGWMSPAYQTPETLWDTAARQGRLEQRNLEQKFGSEIPNTPQDLEDLLNDGVPKGQESVIEKAIRQKLTGLPYEENPNSDHQILQTMAARIVSRRENASKEPYRPDIYHPDTPSTTCVEVSNFPEYVPTEQANPRFDRNIPNTPEELQEMLDEGVRRFILEENIKTKLRQVPDSKDKDSDCQVLQGFLVQLQIAGKREMASYGRPLRRVR